MGEPFEDVGVRIKALRGGLSLREFATKLGVDHKSVSGWEAGKRLPDGSSLLALMQTFSADINYILTGQRSQPVPPAQELPRQEQEWLALYRNSSEDVRAALKAAGNELTKPAKARGKAA